MKKLLSLDHIRYPSKIETKEGPPKQNSSDCIGEVIKSASGTAQLGDLTMR